MPNNLSLFAYLQRTYTQYHIAYWITWKWHWNWELDSNLPVYLTHEPPPIVEAWQIVYCPWIPNANPIVPTRGSPWHRIPSIIPCLFSPILGDFFRPFFGDLPSWIPFSSAKRHHLLVDHFHNPQYRVCQNLKCTSEYVSDILNVMGFVM